MTFWAYLLRCRDGSFYCGHTDSREARLGHHQAGSIDGYTKHRRPVTLDWCQEFPSRLEALEAERRIKGWTRAKKEALIRGDWSRLLLLSRNRQSDGRASTSSARTNSESSPDGVIPVRPELVEGRPELSTAASIRT